MSCCSASPAHVRFFHNINNGDSVTIKLDGCDFVSKLDYGDCTEYLKAPIGNHEVTIQRFLTPDVISTSILEIKPTGNKTVALLGTSNADVKIVGYYDHLQNAKIGTAHVNFIHFATGAPPVDVYINGDKTFSEIQYRQLVCMDIRLGKQKYQTIKITLANSSSAAIEFGSELFSGDVNTIFIIGDVNVALKVISVNDNRNSNIDIMQEKLDIQAHMGEWFQIARIPQFYEVACVNSKAFYTLLPQSVKVFNVCYDKDGNIVDSITGQAVISDMRYPALLTVSFPGFESNSPNYLIHRTDYKNYSLIGSPNRTSFYILARKPDMTECEYEAHLQYAKSLGYDISTIVRN